MLDSRHNGNLAIVREHQHSACVCGHYNSRSGIVYVLLTFYDPNWAADILHHTVFLFMIAFTAISFVHSRDLHWFYVGKSIFVFASMHAILIWYLVKADGVSMTTLARSEKITGSAHAWLVLRAFNSGLGAASSLTVNQGDMARYAKKPKDAIWVSRSYNHREYLTETMANLLCPDHVDRLSNCIGFAMSLWYPGGCRG